MEFKFVNNKTKKTLKEELWNSLIKQKNYRIASTLEEQEKARKFGYLIINSQIWMFNDESIKKFCKFITIILETNYQNHQTKNVTTYHTISKCLKIELELEITNINQGNKKREFEDVLTAIFSRLSEQIKEYEFFFVVDGLELQEINKICFGNIKVVKFDENLMNDFYENNIEINPSYAEKLKKNIADNFLNKVVMICSSVGDSDKAEEIVRYKSKELINYFRYLICIMAHDRISDNMIKINIAAEAYTQTEYVLRREVANNTTASIRGRGRRSLQKFIINENLLNDLEEKAFLNEYKTVLNTELISELEGSIITAIYWTGEAQNEFDLDIAFLKYWTALEAIFSYEEGDTTRTLCKGISITLAFFSSYNFIEVSETSTIYKKIYYLYDKRSTIIHTGLRKSITAQELSEICKYTSYVILSLFELRNQGYTELKQIGREIERLYKIVDREKTQNEKRDKQNAYPQKIN
ncbi:MAG: hypothetical protein HEQ13_14525 [Dolichospermum sp. DEX189]|jgi:hypothetical protein|nr:hypothetical protein [Dolichospermum sp. DEX189]